MKQEQKTVIKGQTVTFFDGKITVFLKDVSGSSIHLIATAPFCRTQEIEKLGQGEKIEFSCSEFDCDVVLTEARSSYSSGGFFVLNLGTMQLALQPITMIRIEDISNETDRTTNAQCTHKHNYLKN